MKSPLLIAGIVAIAVLAAALLAPYLIDWNSQRAGVEAQLERLTGRETTIGGDITVRLFPRPTVRIADVRVGNVEGGTEPFFLTAREINARLSIGPLFSGQAKVSSIELAEPIVNAEILADDRVNWRLGGSLFGAAIDPSAVSLERATIIDGLLRFRDARSEMLFSFANIDAVMMAGSLAGPLTADGQVTLGGNRHDFRVALGSPGEPNGQRLALRLGGVESIGLTALIEGRITPEQGLSGALSLESGPGALADELAGAPADQTPPVRHVLDARLQMTDAKVVLSEISYRASNDSLLAEAGGRAEVSFLRELKLDAALTARLLDADGLAAAASGTVNPLLRIVDNLLPRLADGALSMDLADLRWRGQRLRNASLALRFEPDGFAIERASAAFGAGRLSLAGNASGRSDDSGWLAFDGRTQVEDVDLEATLALIGLDPAIAGELDPQQRRASLNLAANVGVDSDRFGLSGIEATLGGARIDGMIGYRPAGRGRLGADLDITNVSLRRLPGIAAETAPLADRLLPEFGVDVDATIRAEALTLAGVGLKAADFRLQTEPGRAVLRTTRLETTDGARFGINADVRRDGETVTGQYRLSIDGDARAAIAKLRRITGNNEKTAVRIEAARFETAALRLGADIATGAEQTSARMNVSGRLGTSRLDGRVSYLGASLDWRTAMIDLTAELSNDFGAALAAELGLGNVRQTDSAMPGLVRVSANGVPEKGLTLSAGAAGFGAETTVKGRGQATPDGFSIEAEATFNADQPDALYAAFGLPVTGEAAQTPVGLKMALAGSGGEYVISNLTGQFAGTALNINGTADLAADPPAFKLSAGFDEIDLPTLLDHVFLAPGGAAGDDADPLRQFDFAVLDAVSLEIDAAAHGVVLSPDFRLGDARLKLWMDPTGVMLERLTGKYRGGTAEIVALAERRGAEAVIDGRVQLTGARLDEVLGTAEGKPVLRGNLNLAARVKSAGRTLSSLMPALNGEGSIEIEAGALVGINPGTFANALKQAQTKIEIGALVDGILAEGEMAFLVADSRFSIANGLARFDEMTVEADGARGVVETLVEIDTGKIDSEWRLALAGFPEAPPLTVVIAGPADALTRRIELGALKSYLTTRALENRIEKLEQRDGARAQ